MDIRDADLRAHLYRFEGYPLMWKPPKSRFHCWYMGSQQFIVDKTTKESRKTLNLMARLLGDGQRE
jgi:hypothetical protein